MKKVICLALHLVVLLNLYAEKAPDALILKTYKLKNGLTVYLNHDATANSVMGMVVVKGGSKRDPADATGIAHYFEHIMFKGTTQLGTTDYPAEKVYLDSIAAQYELLGQTKDDKKRLEIQLKINDLSVKASEYAIPNEFDKLIKKIGGDHLNAFTSQNQIAYMNSFPANEMEKWLDIYSQRFQEPVFRLFQSELETIYEEKNMYADDMTTPLFEDFMKELFAGTPYGDQTTLGTAEHLKNPSLKKMEEYYHTYYVPNNMALILCGNFDEQTTPELIEQKFGVLESKPLPEQKKFELTPFKGRVQSKHRLLPIRVGLIGFHTVPVNHPDYNALEVCQSVLSNYSTGLLDQLVDDNKLMAAEIESMSYDDLGSSMLLYVPKLVGQSLSNAEKLVMAQIDSVKAGHFNDSLLKAVKLEMIRRNQQRLEDSRYRAYYIGDVFVNGENWDDKVFYADKIDAITKEDVVAVANKYFGDNYLVFQSRMGFPKKDKVKKPPYKPVKPSNTEKHSEYFDQIANMPSLPSEPHFITEGEDFVKGKLNDEVEYYYVNNPINKVFSLRFSYNVGTIEEGKLSMMSYALGYCGAKDISYTDFKKKMQELGSDYYFYANDNKLTAYVTGLETNVTETMKLMNQLLSNPVLDEKQKDRMVKEMKVEKKFDRKDVSYQSDALKDYALYGLKSPELLDPSLKEVKKTEVDEIISMLNKVLKRSMDLHYVGTIGEDQFVKQAKENLSCLNHLEGKSEFLARKINTNNENVIYFLNNKKAVQSHINITIVGEDNKLENTVPVRLFNSYFGGDMSSIVFQEIREYRSLAYGARGSFRLPFDRTQPGYFTGWMTTQADKTNEAVDTYIGLINDMPQYPNRMDDVKSNLIMSVNNNRPSFRYISNSASYWKYLNTNTDPQKDLVKGYESASFDDVEKLYEHEIKGRKMIINIVGDKRKINLDELRKIGKVIEVKTSDIFN
nr:insulinase family protein [uncultured Carboxylicivirga sp.]